MIRYKRASASPTLHVKKKGRMKVISEQASPSSVLSINNKAQKTLVDQILATNQATFPVLRLKGKKGKRIFDTIINSEPGNYDAKKASKEARKYLREQGYYM